MTTHTLDRFGEEDEDNNNGHHSPTPQPDIAPSQVSETARRLRSVRDELAGGTAAFANSGRAAPFAGIHSRVN